MYCESPDWGAQVSTKIILQWSSFLSKSQNGCFELTYLVKILGVPKQNHLFGPLYNSSLLFKTQNDR